MTELELEKTYLAAKLPKDLTSHPSEIISDVYVPETAGHATLRLRRKGETYCITKKEPVDGTDSSRQHEHTINLTKNEYDALATCSRKVAVKRRYQYDFNGTPAEIDVFLDALEGLVLIDFEFSTEAEMENFQPPDICLAEVTQDAFIAGGNLAGKTYQDLQSRLEQYNYRPLKEEQRNGQR